jgi:hypothetical protein
MAEEETTTSEEEHEPLAREGEYIAPEWEKEAYHCPRCGVLAPQQWERLLYKARYQNSWNYAQAALARCGNCRGEQLWIVNDNGLPNMVRPLAKGGPRPHVDMPKDVRDDYEEARSIVALSPRGACALLRLAVQKLCNDLGETGTNINDDIAALVKKGLPVEVQQSLDALRVIGNNAVHPGELDLKDDHETATALFGLLNFIVEDRIAQPKKRAAIFAKVPQKALDAIKKRDSTP